MLSGLDIVVCRVRWPVGYGEEREASHTCAAAALAKLADRPIPIAYAALEGNLERTPPLWVFQTSGRFTNYCGGKEQCTW